MSLARRLVELGRAARAEAKVRTRQPLQPRARRLRPRSADLTTELLRASRRRAQRRLDVEPLVVGGRGPRRVHRRRRNFRELGKRFGKQTPSRRGRDRRGRRRPARGRLVGPPARRRWWSTARTSRSSADDVMLSERPREGWAVVERARRDRRARPRRSPPSCGAPASPARWSARCRRPARTPASRSRDRIAVCGRPPPTASSPRPSASTPSCRRRGAGHRATQSAPRQRPVRPTGSREVARPHLLADEGPEHKQKRKRHPDGCRFPLVRLHCSAVTVRRPSVRSVQT